MVAVLFKKSAFGQDQKSLTAYRSLKCDGSEHPDDAEVTTELRRRRYFLQN